MGAIFEPVHMGPDGPEIVLHGAVKLDNRGLVIEPARHPGLIGHHEGEKARIIGPLHRLARAGHPAQLIRPMGIANILVQHPVAVKEHRPAPRHTGHKGLGLGQGFGNANIDEGPIKDRALQPSLRDQPRKDVLFQRAGQGPDSVQNRPAHGIDAAIDQTRLSRDLLFQKGGDALALQRHRAIAVGIGHDAQGQTHHGLGRQGPGQIAQVHIEQTIAIEQQEGLVELIAGIGQGPGGPGGRRLDRMDDAQTKAANIVGHGLELLGAIAAQQHNLFKAVTGHLVGEPGEEGLAPHIDQGLGHLLGNGPQPGPQSPHQEHALFQD